MNQTEPRCGCDLCRKERFLAAMSDRREAEPTGPADPPSSAKTDRLIPRL